MKISRRKSLWAIIGGAIAPTLSKSNTLYNGPVNYGGDPRQPPDTDYGSNQTAPTIDPLRKIKRINAAGMLIVLSVVLSLLKILSF